MQYQKTAEKNQNSPRIAQRLVQRAHGELPNDSKFGEWHKTPCKRQNFGISETNEVQTKEIEPQSYTEQGQSLLHNKKTLKTCSNQVIRQFQGISRINSGENAQTMLGTDNQLRGGGENEIAPQEAQSKELTSILRRIEEYKKRIETDKAFERIELVLFIKPLGMHRDNHDEPKEELLELDYEIKKRLLVPDSELKVILLTGEAGAGKTLFCKYLRRAMLIEWDKEYQDPDGEDWLPILIDLSSLKNSKLASSLAMGNFAISEILKQELLLSDSEIKLLQENDPKTMKIPRFLFLFDAYEEILQQQHPVNWKIENCIQNNFCMLNGFETLWKHAKAIVTVRRESLIHISDRDVLFGPLDKSTKALIPNIFLELSLQPFSDAQIDSYLKKYVVTSDPINFDEMPLDSLSESWSLVKKIQNTIDSCGLRELVRVPLNLFVFTKVFPDLLQEKVKHGNLGMADKQEDDIQLHKAVSNSLQGKAKYDDLGMTGMKEHDIKPHKQEGATQNAQAESNQGSNSSESFTRFRLHQMFASQMIKSAVESLLASRKTLVEDRQQYEQDFSYLFEKLNKQLASLAVSLSGYYPSISKSNLGLEDGEENKSLFRLCPLLQIDNAHPTNPVKFTHRIFQDFFVAAKLKNEIIDQFEDKEKNDPTSILFNQKLLHIEPCSIPFFRFLVDAVKDKIISTSALTKLIRRSKIDNYQSIQMEEKKVEATVTQESQQVQVHSTRENEVQSTFQHHHHSYSNAAANAITLLNAIRFDFGGADLSRICIAGAYLRYGLFAGANFTGADLQGVNFSNACLRDVKFEDANVHRIQLGVVPDFKIEKEILCSAHSPDGKLMIVGTRGELIVFEKQLDQYPFVIELKRLKGHVGDLTSCSFSPDSKHVLSGGEDRTVRIWNLETSECVKIFREHTGAVIKCSFSEDGKQIISAGKDGTLKKWNASGDDWAISFELQDLEDAFNCGFVSDFNQLMFVGKRMNGASLCQARSGKYIWSFQIPLENQYIINFSFGGRQAVIKTHGSISSIKKLLDCIRGQMTKTTSNFSEDQIILPPLNSSWEKRISANDGCIRLNSEIKCGSEYLNEDVEQNLDLFGANIDNAFGLSEEHIMIFNQADYNCFGPQEMRELILNNQPSELAKIIHLDLNNRSIELHNSKVIGRNMKWANLKRANLSNSNIGDESAVAIGKNTTWMQLQELILSFNGVSDKGATVISENPYWKNLRKLNLRSNKIGSLGGISIGKNTIWESLEELDLCQNEIGEEGAVAIGSNKTWKCLKRLNLGYNAIRNKGAEEIGRNLTWTYLEELNMTNNDIGDEGATTIGKNSAWTNLKTLSLEKNQITDAGASEIAGNKTWKDLEELYLYNNNISKEFTEGLHLKKIGLN